MSQGDDWRETCISDARNCSAGRPRSSAPKPPDDDERQAERARIFPGCALHPESVGAGETYPPARDAFAFGRRGGGAPRPAGLLVGAGAFEDADQAVVPLVAGVLVLLAAGGVELVLAAPGLGVGVGVLHPELVEQPVLGPTRV